MGSSSERDPASYFGFNDLHGFKDFVGYVLLCAPDMFPFDDWRAPDQQMDVDRAFVGLRYGLTLALDETEQTELIATARELVEQAYAEYQAGRDHAGQTKLEELAALLKKVPTH